MTPSFQNSFQTATFIARQAVLMTLLLFSMIGANSKAATIIWDGSDSDAWEDPNNWVGGVLPGDADSPSIGTTASGGELMAIVDVTTDLSLGGTVNFSLVTVGVNNATTSGTLNLLSGSTLKTTSLNIGTGSGTTGVLHLDDSGVTDLTSVTLGSSTGGIGSITRQGTNVANEIISTNLVTVNGNGTYDVATGDVIATQVSVFTGGTLALSDQTLTVPEIQIGNSTSSGVLTRTTGGISVTTLDLVGAGTSVSTTAADVISTNVLARVNAELTLGTDMTTSNVRIQTDGTLNLAGNDIGTVGTPISVFEFAGSSATLTRVGGGNIHADNYEVDSDATFTMAAGDTVTTLLHVQNGTIELGAVDLVTSAELRLGQSSNTAVVSRTTGNIDVGNLTIQTPSPFTFLDGDSVGGTFSADNGTVVTHDFTNQLVVGSSFTVDQASTTYNMGAGANLEIGGSMSVGSLGDVTPRSIFNLGTAAGVGTVTSSVNNQSLRVFDGGELRGWGSVNLSNGSTGGNIRQDGRVVANGFGTATFALDLSSFNTVTNNAENGVGQDNGWFAINGGELILPELSISMANTGNFTWGDSIADTTPDMINSIYFQFDDGVDGGASSAGSLSISLLAVDHPNVEPLLSQPLAVWDITADVNLGFTTVDMDIRYDDILASFQGINEADLKLLHFQGGEWVDITSGVNVTDKIISATGITGFSQFAVAVGIADPAPIPEPSSFALLTLGLAAMVRRRRRSAGK